MIRRIWKSAVMLSLLSMMAITAAAAPLGSISVLTRGGTVALFRVGDFENTQFRLLEEYGGDAIGFDQAISWELAAALAEKAGSGFVKAADLSGWVEFSELDAGLYLLVQRSTPQGYEPFEPFLLSLPWDSDQWNVSLEPKSEGIQPETGDPGQPEEWSVVMTFCGVGILWCLFRGRKEQNHV